MQSQVPSDVAKQIVDFVAAGEKIQAIKLYREQSGLGLKESKDHIEAMEQELRGTGHVLSRADATRRITEALEAGPRGKGTAAPGAEVIRQIEDLLFDGRKIPAIKLYREQSGLGLKEAKDHVEALEAELRTREPGRFTSRPPGKGCVGLVAACGLVALAALLLLFRGFGL